MNPPHTEVFSYNSEHPDEFLIKKALAMKIELENLRLINDEKNNEQTNNTTEKLEPIMSKAHTTNNNIIQNNYNILNKKNNIKETPINNNKITLSTATANNITKEKNKETSLPNTGITNNNLTLLGVTTLITAGILSRRKIPNKKQTKY